MLLLEIKRSRFNPLGVSKKPRTFAGECFQGKCLRCRPDLDPDRQSRSRAMLTSSYHSSVSSLSLASNGSSRSINSRSNHGGPGNNQQHESQTRLRGRLPHPVARSPPGFIDPIIPVQGVLTRDPPSRSLSDDSSSVVMRQRQPPNRSLSSDDIWSSRNIESEPRRRSRRPQLAGSRSFSPPPSKGLKSAHQSKKEHERQVGSKTSSHDTVDTVAVSVLDGSCQTTELLCTSSTFSFNGSICSAAHRDQETTLEDIKRIIRERRASQNADLLAEALVDFMQEDRHSILLFCLDVMADQEIENQSLLQALIRHNVCKPLSNIISRHFGDEKMVGSAFAALRILTTDSKARNALVELSLSDYVVEAMQCNPSNSTIQCDGCAILSNLAVDAVNTKVEQVKMSVISVVLEAMKQHENDEAVVSGACFAFKNFTYETSNLRTMSRTDGLMDALKAVLDRFESIFEAYETFDRLCMALAEDESLEESIVAMLQMEAQSVNAQGPETIVSLLETLEMYSWSREVASQCLAMLADLAGSSEMHKAKLLNTITLNQLRARVNECGHAKSIEQNLAAVADFFHQESSISNKSLDKCCSAKSVVIAL